MTDTLPANKYKHHCSTVIFIVSNNSSKNSHLLSIRRADSYPHALQLSCPGTGQLSKSQPKPFCPCAPPAVLLPAVRASGKLPGSCDKAKLGPVNLPPAGAWWGPWPPCIPHLPLLVFLGASGDNQSPEMFPPAISHLQRLSESLLLPGRKK